MRSASSVLEALAKRVPSTAHLQAATAALVDVPLDQVDVGDRLLILPHEICPVDGVVVEGHGVMDESYLTGEPFMMSKTPGSAGALGGDQRRVGADDRGRAGGRSIRATPRSCR